MSPTMLAPWLLALLMVTSVRTADKYVAFEMSPTEVFPHCTPLMMLRCSVNSTSSTTPGMGSLGETEVTVANVHWNALIIKKEGVAIASVTYSDSVNSYTPANVYDNSTNIAVGGSLLSSEEECGFLEVTWTDPMFSLNGTYECVANGLDTVGNQHSFSVTAGVIIGGATEAHMDALKQHISELEASLTECEAPTTAAPAPATTRLTFTDYNMIPLATNVTLGTPQYFKCETDIGPDTGPFTYKLLQNGTEVADGTRSGAGANTWQSYAPLFDAVGVYTYTCTAQLTGGSLETSSEIPLTIIAPVNTLTVSQTTFVDGEDVIFECKTTGQDYTGQIVYKLWFHWVPLREADDTQKSQITTKGPTSDMVWTINLGKAEAHSEDIVSWATCTTTSSFTDGSPDPITYSNAVEITILGYNNRAETTTATVPASTPLDTSCEDGKFYCIGRIGSPGEGTTCFPDSFMCDGGDPDCEDGSDEAVKTCF